MSELANGAGAAGIGPAPSPTPLSHRRLAELLAGTARRCDATPTERPASDDPAFTLLAAELTGVMDELPEAGKLCARVGLVDASHKLRELRDNLWAPLADWLLAVLARDVAGAAAVEQRFGPFRELPTDAEAAREDEAARWSRLRGAVARLGEHARSVLRAIAPDHAEAAPRKARRRPRPWHADTESRNRFVYEQCCEGLPYCLIIEETQARPEWEPLNAISSVKRAAGAYAERHALPPIPKRRGGRPPRAKNCAPDAAP